MAALRGEETCFIHSPKTRSARSAARSRGGSANRQPAEPAAPPAPPAALNLGPLESAADLTRALTGLARAIAVGSVDVRRGRAIGDALRTALQAIDSSGVGTGDVPLGGREATDLELKWMAATKREPPGTQFVGDTRIWLTGSEWRPDEAEKLVLERHDEEQRLLEEYRRKRARGLT